MKKQNTNNQMTDLAKFYEVKAKERSGGSFFKILVAGRPTRTIWGRDRRDVVSSLANAGEKYDGLVSLR